MPHLTYSKLFLKSVMVVFELLTVNQLKNERYSSDLHIDV